MTLGTVMAFLSLNKSFNMPISQVSMQANSIIMALAGAERIFKMMDETSETDEGYVTLVNAKYDANDQLVETTDRTGLWAWKHPHHDGTTTYHKLAGDITFTDVDFGYVPEKTVLHDINLYGRPGQKIAFVGSTGAGKTTITNLIKHILTEAGHRVGLIGTIQNEIGDKIVHTDNTTPFVYDLMGLYAQMAEAGCDYVVMEVSSFGLVQERIGVTHFDTAVFTNLTQDHLDYHGTMENYYQAKKLLFQRCDNAVIDTDDAYGRRLYEEISCPKCSYGSSSHADYYADAIKLRADGTRFWLCNAGKSYQVNLHLTGMFNVSNAIAAVAACASLGMP